MKELVLKDVPLTGKVADKILRDLKRMRSCGIYPGDIHVRNYKAGLLVDLSVARTEPYYLFELRRPKQVELMKRGDLYRWEEMVEKNNVNTRLRAVRNHSYCAKLRPRKRKTRIRR